MTSGVPSSRRFTSSTPCMSEWSWFDTSYFQPPKRPRGKNATIAAGEYGEDAEEAEATERTRREEMRDDQGGQGADRVRRDASTVAPFKELKVGDGRQATDPDVPSAFEPTEAESEEESKKKE